MTNLAVGWSPSQLVREDRDDHPEVSSLKEACRRVAEIDARGFISVRFDSFDPPIVKWEIDNVEGMRLSVAVRTACPGRCK